MTARAMPGVSAEKSARAGCVVVALRGELDVCTAAGGLSALTAPAAAGARVIVDLAELAFMDCYSLNEIMAARAQARRGAVTWCWPAFSRLCSGCSSCATWSVADWYSPAWARRSAAGTLRLPS